MSTVVALVHGGGAGPVRPLLGSPTALDELTTAIASAMTLFGRVEIRRITSWSAIVDASVDRLVA